VLALRWALVLAGLTALGGCAHTATAVAAEPWHELRSPRFAAWTDGDPEQARALLLDLERFHTVLLAKTTAQDRQGMPPLRIFLTKDPNSFRALTGAPMQARGLFVPTDRGNYALVGADSLGPAAKGALSGRQVLFHEYTHYILASNGSQVPSWYNEGFAEYMSTTEFRDDGGYTLGCPPQYRTAAVAQRQWLPMAELFTADDIAALSNKSVSDTSDSYMESWYAVHYFSADAERQKQLASYLRLWAGGLAPDDAAQRALGLSLTGVDNVLRKYSMQPRFACVTIKPVTPFVAAAVQVRPLTTAEAQREIGDLLLALLGPGEASAAVLRDAQKAQPNDPALLLSLARAHYLRSRARGVTAADARAELASAAQGLVLARQAKGDETAILTLEGQLLRRRAELDLADRKPYGDELQGARKAYRKAIHRDEGASEALLGLGLSYQLADNGSEEAQVALEAAAYLLPLDAEVALAMAELQIGREHNLQALPALEYALRWTRDPDQRARAHALAERVRSAAAAPPRDLPAPPE